ncbi:cobalamin biosynthesis protein CobG [Novosphingobium sp. BL-52-GroH]|uniref:cobalamin biosynthesis protein CobG n=1 Tax=Novosphingobium sp. BL-52-GroH TaxID=3349877 RepID=UPI00384FC6E4
MAAGDGLIVRIRPRLARLSRGQVAGLCTLADRFGNGMIDVTSRANLQVRGVAETGWAALLEGLCALDLVDPEPTIEQRRNVLVAPDWIEGDATWQVATDLAARLHLLPDLPAKAGFAIDAGVAPVLADVPADFRIERAASGGLLLRAQGRATGIAVPPDEAADALVALAAWFVATGGMEAGRMARHRADLPSWATGGERGAPPRAALVPGRHVLGPVRGVPFGSTSAAALAALMECSQATAMRVTPWRVLLLEGGKPVEMSGFVDDASHCAMRAEACPGLPLCPQATVATRALALRLAPHVGGRLHVSGCAKGCAHGGAAAVTLTGREGRFDLGRDARAGDPPVESGLDPEDLLARFGAE